MPTLSRPSTRRRNARRNSAVAAALLTLALTGCGSDDGGTTAAAAGSADDLDVPEECRAAFPVAVGTADLDDVSLLPASWPAPPVEATLCRTGSTLDDTTASAEYATDVPAAEVLDAYEAALSTSYDVTREDGGAGETLAGTADGVPFEISTRDGAFAVTFASS